MNSSSAEHSIQERVYLKRVRLFFGHGVPNIISALMGALLVAMILVDAGVSIKMVSVWALILLLFSVFVLIIERAFIRANITLSNALKWVWARTLFGVAIGIMYGLLPYLFGDSLLIHHQMFLFIILSAMVSVASTGYTLMPAYYFTLNGVTMMPLTIYFATEPGFFNTVLALTALIWQVVVLSKSWKVSKTAINEIYLNESLRDEIEKHEETKEQLQYMATHDSLTGLPNRQRLMEHLDFLIKRAMRYETRIVVMFVDLDGFKEINDMFGHESGDHSLREISNRLLGTIREIDMVARFGGDEFVLIYSDIGDSKDEPTILAQRILQLLREPVAVVEGETRQLSGSIGIAIYPDTATSSKALIRAADEAMYTTKAMGKNHYSFAGSSSVES